MQARAGLLTIVLILVCIGISAQAQENLLLYDFESGLDDWLLVDGWGAGTGLSHGATSDGRSILQLDVTYSGNGWQEAGVFINPPVGTDWSAYATLSMEVYAPEGAENFIAQIYLKTGENWAWTNTPNTALIPGAWTTVIADLSMMGLIRDVRELGIKIGTNLTPFDGAFFIDNVTLATKAADEVETSKVISEIRAITHVEPLNDTVGRYEKFELSITLDATFNNPYDPNDIRLDASFTAPSGQVIAVPGFYYQDFSFQISDGVEHIEPTDDWSWRVRFTPTEIGEWQYIVSASTEDSIIHTPPTAFTVVESEQHGFVRIDSRNSRYLAFDDGTPFFAVGENMSWYGDGKMVDYEQWLNALSDAGGNYIRVWLASWGFEFEWIDTGLGNYDARQNRAYRLDRLFDMVETHDIYVMLCLINHGRFSYNVNSEWDANPYNAANGGPLKKPEDFATSPEAIRLWHQKLRYIAARWGYSPNLLAWEWWNEVEWTPLANSDILVPWIEDSTTYLNTLDPYNHLVTHSGSARTDMAVWELPTIDFTQDHRYNLNDWTGELSETTSSWLEQYPDKPFLLGEFGYGQESELDPLGIGLHLGLWSTPMSGALGTGMFWWWDSYIHPYDMYDHIKAVANFFKDEDMAARDWRLTEATLDEGTSARIYGLQSDNYALLWVVSKAYENSLRDGVEKLQDIDVPEIHNALLTLVSLDDGTYTVEWWDPQIGEIITTDQVTISNGQASLNMPSFWADLALKVCRSQG